MKNSVCFFIIFIALIAMTFRQTRRMIYCSNVEDHSYSQIEICKKLSENSFASGEEAKKVVGTTVDACVTPQYRSPSC